MRSGRIGQQARKSRVEWAGRQAPCLQLQGCHAHKVGWVVACGTKIYQIDHAGGGVVQEVAPAGLGGEWGMAFRCVQGVWGLVCVLSAGRKARAHYFTPSPRVVAHQLGSVCIARQWNSSLSVSFNSLVPTSSRTSCGMAATCLDGRVGGHKGGAGRGEG